jgi:NAD(P)-dependent dehydrogenase (short-subunit alcohol dehydrogenase family)
MPGTSPLMQDQVIAIFGCGPGMGLASGSIIGRHGGEIAAIDVLGPVAEASADVLRAEGVKARPYTADALDADQVRDVLAQVKRDFGRVTGVLNLIGKGLAIPLGEIDKAAYDGQFDINFRHHVVVTQAAVPYLAETRGAYVAMSSIYGLSTSPLRSMYGAAKAALGSLIQNLALQFGPEGVRFNAIAPGSVSTPRAKALGMDAGPLHDEWVSRIPLGRMAEPEDIGNVVMFLLSDLGSYITGQVITVDGGIMINAPLRDDGANPPPPPTS